MKINLLSGMGIFDGKVGLSNPSKTYSKCMIFPRKKINSETLPCGLELSFASYEHAYYIHASTLNFIRHVHALGPSVQHIIYLPSFIREKAVIRNRGRTDKAADTKTKMISMV
uniref:Uncharacterized protein n=1 Tax=Cacopsylla melanoneura TaxID=428564 RepID=A0A8D9E2C3_9HEMI